MKPLIFIVTGVILVVAYDQMARRGIVPKIFTKKDDSPTSTGGTGNVSLGKPMQIRRPLVDGPQNQVK